MPITCCVDYCSFNIQFYTIGLNQVMLPFFCCSFSKLLWLFGVSSGTKQFFKIVFSISVENAIGILVRIALNMEITLGNIFLLY